ncbi:O-acetyl-ADP-ribose deacetylase [Rothia uropygioeca]|uniref:O-acetyl-ADP-ribose deacetylase n=1 Tax=Kocuria sp. 257 TaxID=2021970 RepID=UPI001013C2A6|nr:O-acetyl-ADP-ribose deacetylase [Kocuria sp. 257]
MDIEIRPGDITEVEADAIVNAANSSLMGGGGVDGAIHRAGGPAILEECKKVRETDFPDGLPAGRAVATTAGDLPAQWVIHTVGPTYAKTEEKYAEKAPVLASCYRSALQIAAENGAESVAFPTISAGVYGWPMDDATRIAVEAIRAMKDQVGDTIRTVVLVPFGQEAEDGYRAALAE